MLKRVPRTALATQVAKNVIFHHSWVATLDVRINLFSIFTSWKGKRNFGLWTLTFCNSAERVHVTRSRRDEFEWNCQRRDLEDDKQEIAKACSIHFKNWHF